jgi:acetylornithine deacetylase/succinyl-diaminopimelate desuccinylase-like protein
MDVEAFLERLLAIQSIPAPTFQEEERAKYLESSFKAAGLIDVERDEISNVFGRIKGGDLGTLVVSAHLDTVFSQDTLLEVKQRENRLIGPGVGDNALGLAALVELASAFPHGSLPGDLWLVANVCEEGLGNLKGMRGIVDRFGDSVLGYLILEGMALGHIYHRALPVRRYRIEASAAGGHAWIHRDRPSAIHTLLRLGERILSITLPESPRTTLNIGRIEGGTTVNSIAQAAHMEMDLRSEDENTLSKMEEMILDLLRSPMDSGLTVNYELIGERPGGEIPADHPLVVAAKESLLAVGIQSIQLETGSTDASLPLSLGFPAVCVGVSHGGEAHSLEEYIEIELIPRGFVALTSLIQKAFHVLPERAG